MSIFNGAMSWQDLLEMPSARQTEYFGNQYDKD